MASPFVSDIHGKLENVSMFIVGRIVTTQMITD